jgi:hypothetical protein
MGEDIRTRIQFNLCKTAVECLLASLLRFLSRTCPVRISPLALLEAADLIHCLMSLNPVRVNPCDAFVKCCMRDALLLLLLLLLLILLLLLLIYHASVRIIKSLL